MRKENGSVQCVPSLRTREYLILQPNADLEYNPSKPAAGLQSNLPSLPHGKLCICQGTGVPEMEQLLIKCGDVVL
jgi:hypothetical protein